MKKTFIIFCNPKKDSFSEAIANAYKKGSKKINKEVKTVNVYDIKIDEYYNFDDKLSPKLKQFQDNIIWADELVFIYPVWWLGFPAKLKSIIEKTFLKNIVAGYSPKGYPIPLLKSKKAVIVQTYDMPVFVMKLLGGDISFKHLKGILGICGIKTKKRFDFGRMIKSTPEIRKKWLDKVEAYAQKS